MSIIKEILKKTGQSFFPNSVLIHESLKKKFSFQIDTVDACNLRCVHCHRGVNYKKNTSKKMGLDVLERLLDKITSECECKDIGLYNWTEPFLNPELDKCVAAIMSRGIGCLLSSNLSLNKPAMLEAVLSQKPTLVVSVSGFEQKTHELYHKGSDVSRVKESLKYIAGFREKQNLELHVEVHCLQFVDNQQDQMMWEHFCKEHGFIFVAKPAHGCEVSTPETAERLIVKPRFEEMPDGQVKVKNNLSDKPVLNPCFLHNAIPLNCDCDVYLCCIYGNTARRRIGNFFDLPLKEIQRLRLSHRECAYCRWQG
ncbi:MAG: radical SAM protein [Nitrospirota bacterium]